VTVTGSSAAQTFSIENQGGTMSYPCTVATKGGCPTGGWGG
jgi:hypothetical protein